MKIKVLGPGCINCKTLLETTQTALQELGLGRDAEVKYVTDLNEIRKYLMMTPGLVINEKVAHQGKPLPNVAKVKELIQKSQGS
ncbi:MAG: redox-active disulfide protein 2 [Deltaproteobacteria bacterium RBG_13_61_14]|nr:MAG: redox-active disulfide protein 2 [Deltaproteobacteria bacterium RBG_13_61_14]